MLGPAAFELDVQKEIARVDSNKKMPKHTGPSNLKKKPVGEGTGYKHFFPDSWHAEATAIVNKHYASCADMVDWLVAEGKEMFEGTTAETTWATNGDGLAQWWADETQQYFKDTYPAEWARQIRAVGEVNAGFPNYKGSLVGNSPEFMPLDSNLFADIERLIIVHRALTYEYAAGDARRFSIGTPKQCASTVRRVWEMIPGHRIIRDCDRWQEAYVQVNKAGGKVVRGFGRVTGRRSGLQRGNPEVPTQFHADAADGVKALLDLA